MWYFKECSITNECRYTFQVSELYLYIWHRQDMWTLSDCAWLNDQVRIHVMCINDAWLQYYYYTGDQLLYGFVNGKF